jgi:uncharacterized repeat protein (TIGR03803 family)
LTLTGGVWKSKTIHMFKGSGAGDGSGPRAQLLFDAQGSLYGTTQMGGTKNLGTVFRLSPTKTGGWKETVLYQFQGGNDGDDPDGGVVLDAQGNRYGTTSSGGGTAISTATEGCRMLPSYLTNPATSMAQPRREEPMA